MKLTNIPILAESTIDATPDMKKYIKDVERHFLKNLYDTIKAKKTHLTLKDLKYTRTVDGGKYGKFQIKTTFKQSKSGSPFGSATHVETYDPQSGLVLVGSIYYYIDDSYFIEYLGKNNIFASAKEKMRYLMRSIDFSKTLLHELIHIFDPKLSKLRHNFKAINVRSEPNSYSKIVCKVYDYETVGVLKKYGNWVKIRADIGSPKEGYINKKFLKPYKGIGGTQYAIAIDRWVRRRADAISGTPIEENPLQWANYYTSPWEIDAFSSEYADDLFKRSLKQAHYYKTRDPQINFLVLLKSCIKESVKHVASADNKYSINAPQFWRNPDLILKHLNIKRGCQQCLKKVPSDHKFCTICGDKIVKHPKFNDSRIRNYCKMAWKKYIISINNKYQQFADKYNKAHKAKPYEPTKKRYPRCFHCNKKKLDEPYTGIEKFPYWVCKDCYDPLEDEAGVNWRTPLTPENTHIETHIKPTSPQKRLCL